MINIDIRERENIFIVTPDSEIRAEDIVACVETVNTYINTYDRVPNLVLHATSFPHWKNFNALITHFKLIKNHHNIVKKVAVVSDSKLIALLHPLVDHFAGAKVRRFPEMAFDDAVNWVEMVEDHPGAIVEIEGLPCDVVAVEAKGIITSQDYRETLIPLIEAKLKEYEKLKLLCVVGTYFDGFSAGALWDDTRFGLSHFTTFLKLALVSDVEWVRHSVKLFGPLMPTEVMVFSLAEIDDAKEWITT